MFIIVPPDSSAVLIPFFSSLCAPHCAAVIQAIWSPHVCRVERRTNIHRIWDRRFSEYERAVTFEGPQFNSEEGAQRLPTPSPSLDEDRHAEFLGCSLPCVLVGGAQSSAPLNWSHTFKWCVAASCNTSGALSTGRFPAWFCSSRWTLPTMCGCYGAPLCDSLKRCRLLLFPPPLCVRGVKEVVFDLTADAKRKFMLPPHLPSCSTLWEGQSP